MKRLFTTIIMAFCTFFLFAQEMPMTLYVYDGSGDIPEYSLNRLQLKLQELIAAEGINGDANYATFALCAAPAIVSKNVITGVRPTVAMSVEVYLFIGNNLTEEKMASTIITLNGAGTNENQAISSALGSLSRSDSRFSSFMKNGKNKIIRYYDSQAPQLILQARNYATQRQYDRALWLLSSIPTFCSSYDSVQSAMLDIWKSYVDYTGEQNLAKARSIWISTQNREGAARAAEYLSQIYPDAACYGSALALADSIQDRIGDEWNFMKIMYRDGVDLEFAKIEAARAVGIAYGDHQQPITYNEHWFVR